MAIPILTGLARQMAKYGYKAAKGLSSKSISSAAKKVGATPYGAKAAKFASKQFKKLPKKGKKMITQQKVKDIGRGAAQKYDKLYDATLGTKKRRQITSAGLGGVALGSFLSGDDIDS